MTLLALFAALALAVANGANDNFKGVATLYGSGTASYRTSLAWATSTTFAGSIAAAFAAVALAKTFAGSGIVPAEVASSAAFIAAVTLGAAATVLLATWLGLPVSTTHALTGALVGSGLVAAGSAVNVGALGAKIVVPLLVSPLVSVALARVVYFFAHTLREKLGIASSSCVCIGGSWIPQATLATAPQAGALLFAEKQPSVWVGEAPACVDRYEGALFGVSAQKAVDVAHFISAGAVSFARGLNDTPKLVGILLAAHATGQVGSSALVGAAVAIGGVLGARRVAATVSHRIATFAPGQGLVANVVTALLVTTATPLGLPVSTTHVSTGSIVGIGLANGTARWDTIKAIVLVWVTTLPIGAVLAAACYAALSRPT